MWIGVFGYFAAHVASHVYMALRIVFDVGVDEYNLVLLWVFRIEVVLGDTLQLSESWLFFVVHMGEQHQCSIPLYMSIQLRANMR